MKFKCLFILLFLVSCEWPPGPEDMSRYKDIEWASVPLQCDQFKDDVCGLFSCMVDQCWCDDSNPELPILYEKEGVKIMLNFQALNYTKQYLKEKELNYTVKNIVKLNNIFFNVFAEDEIKDEIVFTLAADGTIFKTICGV